MNRPKDARLLAALVFVTAALGAAATWSLWDWSRDLAAAPPTRSETPPETPS